MLTIPAPVFRVIVDTRAALGLGLGLLLSDRLSPQRRRAVGMGLVAVGAAATIPTFVWIRRALERGRSRRRERRFSPMGHDERLIGVTRFPRRGDDELAG
jgi:hypothetical protein